HNSTQQEKIKSLLYIQHQPPNTPQFSSKSLLHCNYIIHTTGIQDFTKNFFSPRNRCLQRSYKGIYKTFNLFIYLDNGQWTHGGCRSIRLQLVDFFQNLPQCFLFSTFFNKKHLKTLLYQHLFSYYKNVVVSIYYQVKKKFVFI